MGLKEERRLMNYKLVLGEVGIDLDEADRLTPPDFSRLVEERVGEKIRARQEEDIAAQVVRVRLGGEEYEIGVRPIGQDREWRRRCGELAADLLRVVFGGGGMSLMDGADGADEKGEMALGAAMIAKLGDALPVLFTDGLDKVIDLFFLYSGLNREEIEGKATALEIMDAAMRVFEVHAFPFVRAMLAGLMRLAMRGGLMSGRASR